MVYSQGENLPPAHRFGPPVPKRKSKTWLWVLLAAGLVLVLCGGGCGVLAIAAGSSDDATGVISDTATASPAEAKTSQAADGKARDGGWRMDSIKFTNEIDIPQATARITNESADSTTAIFEISLLEGDKLVATFMGSANGVEKGKTTTVKFLGENVDGWSASKKYTLQFTKSL